MATDGDGGGGELGTEEEVDEGDGDRKVPPSGPCCWALER